MSKVTEVVPQKNNPKRFNVFLDGEFSFGADEDLIVEYRLVEGKIIDTPLLEKLLFEAEVGKLMEKMYGLFNIRQRSEQEIRRYLKNLSFKRKTKEQDEISDSAINLVIVKLKQKGFLNDLEFAKAWIEARRRSKQKSDRLIKFELQQKGVGREIIDQVFSEQLTGYSQEGLAEQALQKRVARWEKLPKIDLNEKSLRDLKKKAYQYLAGKGFDYETISSVIEKILEKE